LLLLLLLFAKHPAKKYNKNYETKWAKNDQEDHFKDSELLHRNGYQKSWSSASEYSP